MNTEQQIIADKISSQNIQAPPKETYHAPQVKIHGKLERMTLQDTSPTPISGGGGGGTGNTADE